MPTPQELEQKLWKALKSDRTVMLGVDCVEEGHLRPMTALIDGERGPLWFFTAKDTALVKTLRTRESALISFASKGHQLFATIHGALSPDNNRAMIEKLWNPFVAAWFEGGKDDPKLALLRFDPEGAEVWENDNSLFAGIKLMLGRDPKQAYRDKVAKVAMR
jgi:general stress protein 26